MLYITIIIVAVALAYFLAKLQEKMSARAVAQTPAKAEAEAPAQEVRKVLTIDGTEPFKGHIGFVKSFGIPPAEVSDLRFFSGPDVSLNSLPHRVRDCLNIAYNAGSIRGVEVPALVEGDRNLAPDEALYFALVQNTRMPPFVVAFIDKLRSK